MRGVMIRYEVRSDQVERNLELVRAVYEELDSTRPGGLRQATFQLDDEVSFLEFVVGPDLPAPLPQIKAFKRFRSTLDERCDEPPVVTEILEIGSFRLY